MDHCLFSWGLQKGFRGILSSIPVIWRALYGPAGMRGTTLRNARDPSRQTTVVGSGRPRAAGGKIPKTSSSSTKLEVLDFGRSGVKEGLEADVVARAVLIACSKCARGFHFGSIRNSYVFVIEFLERQEVGLWTSGVSRCGFRRRAG